MVNSGLMVLSMLREYLDITRRLPLLSTEVVHRVAELLKLFNSRTCQVLESDGREKETNRNEGFGGAGRQETLLERRKNPKLARRTCTCEYGLQSW